MKRRIWKEGSISPCYGYVANGSGAYNSGTVWECTVEEVDFAYGLYDLSNCKAVAKNVFFGDCSKAVKENTLHYRDLDENYRQELEREVKQ